MNFNKDDKSFYDSYGIYKEDALEVLTARIERLLTDLKGAIEWNKQHSSQNQEDQSS